MPTGYPTMAYRIMFEYGFFPIDDSKFETYSIPGEPAYKYVHNFANRPRNMNIAIKLDSTEIDQYDILESDT